MVIGLVDVIWLRHMLFVNLPGNLGHLSHGLLVLKLVFLKRLIMARVGGATNLSGVHVVIAFLLHVLLFLTLESHIVQDAEILQEIIFITILGKDFKDAYHLVVSIIDKLMEEGNGLEMDHAEHAVFPKDLVLELHDPVDVFIVFLISISVKHSIIIIFDFNISIWVF